MDWCKRTFRGLEQGCPHDHTLPVHREFLCGEKHGGLQQSHSSANCPLCNVESNVIVFISSFWDLVSVSSRVFIKIWLMQFFCIVCKGVLTVKASTSRALNYFMRKLYASKFFTEGDVCSYIITAGVHFLQGYSWLARECWQIQVLRFPTMPKTHMLFHVVHTMRVQYALFGYFENPVSMSCSSDEDFIGRVCELTRKVSPRQRIRRCMERYLTQVLLIWYRAAK